MEGRDTVERVYCAFGTGTFSLWLEREKNSSPVAKLDFPDTFAIFALTMPYPFRHPPASANRGIQTCWWSRVYVYRRFASGSFPATRHLARLIMTRTSLPTPSW